MVRELGRRLRRLVDELATGVVWVERLTVRVDWGGVVWVEWSTVVVV